MKKILIVLSISILLTSCQQIYNTYGDDVLSKKFQDIKLWHGNFSEIDNEMDIVNWIEDHVEYKETDEVQSPKKTADRGKGDCDCFSILYMNILYVRFGQKSSLCIVNTDRKIVKGGAVNHAIVRLPDGALFDPLTDDYCEYEIGYEYSFDHVFSKKGR